MTSIFILLVESLIKVLTLTGVDISGKFVNFKLSKFLHLENLTFRGCSLPNKYTTRLYFEHLKCFNLVSCPENKLLAKIEAPRLENKKKKKKGTVLVYMMGA